MRRTLIAGALMFTALCAGAQLHAPRAAEKIAYGVLSINTPKVLGEATTTTAAHQSVRFVGDVMLARDVETKMQTYGSSYPFSSLPPTPADAYLIGNFESSISPAHIHTKDFNFAFSVDPKYVHILKEYGFTALGLANNHSYDFGADGFDNTWGTLKKADLSPFGDPTDQASTSIPILTIGTSTRVAIVPFYAVHGDPDDSVIKELIKRAQKESDIQIAFIHWGTEYQSSHDVRQQILAHKLIDDGIDAVVGHHPHVVEDVELYKDKPIFYSLGNFIFDQYFSEAVQEGLMLSMDASPTSIQFSLKPVSSIDSHTSPRLMKDAECTAFLADLAGKSSLELAPMIKAGFVIAPRDH